MDKKESNRREMEENFIWFLGNYNQIYKQYGTCYVVIKRKKILGVYNNKTIALDETKKAEKSGTYNIQFCNGNETAYTAHIYTPRFS